MSLAERCATGASSTISLAKRSATGASSSTSVTPTTSTALTKAADSATHIMQAVVDTKSPEVAQFALRHMAMIAKQRNAYGLMECVVRTCEQAGIDLSSVLSPVGDAGSDADDTHPLEILQVVSASTGYCQARTIQGDGRHSLFNNPAFEHDILSHEACVRAYERNKEELLTLFVHAEDVAGVHALIAATWREAVSRSGQITMANGSQPVRVLHRRLRSHIPCSIRITMLITVETGRVSAALELAPSIAVELGHEAGVGTNELAPPLEDVIHSSSVDASGDSGGAQQLMVATTATRGASPEPELLASLTQLDELLADDAVLGELLGSELSS